MPSPFGIVVSCEHAGNEVPKAYRPLLAPYRQLVESHRGYDPGSLQLARRFAEALGCTLHATRVTRLLVEVNRSPKHRAVFSELTRGLPDVTRTHLLERYYQPHRSQVESDVRSLLSGGESVLHLSVHTFTPQLDGRVRRADVGLLYDPKRPAEARFCRDWQTYLKRQAPDLRVRRNYPYRGVSDGLTTYLRRAVRTRHYLGIELEVNQRFPLTAHGAWIQLQRDLVATLKDVVDQHDTHRRFDG